MSSRNTTFASVPGRIGVGHAGGTLGRHILLRPLLWIVAIALAAFLGWAANAPLEETTRGPGKVVPLSRSQVIQSLEGGVLETILVQEGEEVAAGQTLAVINDTRFRTAYEDLEGQIVALKAALIRLRAERAGASAVRFEAQGEEFPPDIIAMETQLFAARRQRFVQAVASLEERLALAVEQFELVQPLVERGAASPINAIELERSIADLRGELADARNLYSQEVNDQIAQKSTELASLIQQSAQRRDTLTRAALTSPVRGIVKNLEITTRGGVVAPGETIMEVVPLDDQLYIEAEIKPQDVAFLHVGQPARVKITAYDYTIYGMLTGELVFISADTILDDTRRNPEPYYRVRVLTDSAALEGPDGPLPIRPGMVAEVDIQTGSKTVLEYLLKPILRGSEAFHER